MDGELSFPSVLSNAGPCNVSRGGGGVDIRQWNDDGWRGADGTGYASDGEVGNGAFWRVEGKTWIIGFEVDAASGGHGSHLERIAYDLGERERW